MTRHESSRGSLLRDVRAQLRSTPRWLVLNAAGIAILIATGMAWTRVQEKNVLQVLLTFVLPVCIVSGFAALQAVTIRAFHRLSSGEDDFNVGFAWGAATLLLCMAAAVLLWRLVDVLEAYNELWASDLYSRFNADRRSHLLTYEHLYSSFNAVTWFLRWVVLPGLLIPLSNSAAHGLRRTTFRGALRVWMNWRWWPVVLVLALVGQALPQMFFTDNPTGSVRTQVAKVLLKLVAAYLLGVLAWVLALFWSAQLFHGTDQLDRGQEPLTGRSLLDSDVPEGVGGNA